ncbi:MAG: DICT sensory domain-containing protein [Xenococcaceae cyanobacterium MO_167.B27]|nr:DICT sensory domain-containing protein [Xenococcaceae cyanobacterium MO_167.B27]
MTLTSSLMRDLVTEYSSVRPQIYFKSSLLALARAMEDLVLVNDDLPLVIANFQQERFFRSQERRFSRIAQKTDQVYVLAVPDAESGFAVVNSGYETIPLEIADILAGEKCLVIIGEQYTACLVGQEKLSLNELREMRIPIEQGKRFEGFWTFDRNITRSAADWLLGRIQGYRPELAEKLEQARQFYNLTTKLPSKPLLLASQSIDIGIFTQRLVTYLQAGQYKLLKAYRTIAVAERKEHLINKIAQAQRHSLNPQEILKITVRELGKIFSQCRCLLYRINPDDTKVTIEYEFVPSRMPSLLGQQWSVVDNPIFLVAQTQDSALVINDVANNVYLQENPILKEKIKRAAIDSWLMVSIRYQETLLGVLELHYGGTGQFQWQSEDVALVEAVASSAGVALTQASAYNNLADLNQQLAAIERIQNNLIAVVGHELRTPLSTIRICLESLADEPDMPRELRDSMLDTALSDSERLGQLIQDFLTLSQLEAGKAYRNIELLQIEYALDLALSRIQGNSQITAIPEIKVQLSHQLPSVLADVEGLVEVLYKLLDNACKFTSADGEVLITARIQNVKGKVTANGVIKPMLEVIVADTGRGIEASQLEIIFDRFSQSESYLRRTVSGVGLGLVICRQIINGMGGQIWAISEGKNRGSEFHFTIPIES